MKRLLIISMLLVLYAGSSAAQWFPQRGLEIYNPWFHNPAFVGTDQTVQIDLSGHNFRWNSGAWASVMTTLPRLNSSAGIRCYFDSYPDLGKSGYVQLAYAYEHSFSGELQLKGGVAFSHAKTNYEEDAFGEDLPDLVGRTNGLLGLGLALQYKGFYAGFSTQFSLYANNEISIGNDQTEISKETSRSSTIRFLSGYTADVLDWLKIDPILGLDYYILRGGASKELKGYLGSKLLFLDHFGIGFTLGNIVSVSGSVELFDRLTLMLGLYAGEHEFFEGMELRGYTLGANDFEIIGQIRVRL